MTAKQRCHVVHGLDDGDEVGARSAQRLQPVQRVAVVGVERAAVLDGDGKAEALLVAAGLHQLQREAEYNHLQEVPVLGDAQTHALLIGAVSMWRCIEARDRDHTLTRLTE